MTFNRALVIVALNAFVASLATFLSYFYAVAPITLDAGSTERGWPLAWVTEWWSSWTVPPSSGSVFDPIAFSLDFLFWLAVLLVPVFLCIRRIGRHSQNPGEISSEIATKESFLTPQNESQVRTARVVHKNWVAFFRSG
jgi:hypothetical protein